MRISIIGSGYVGLVTGTCFAELGNHVILVDIVKDKVDKINSGIAPIFEEGLDKMLRKNIGDGSMHATTKVEHAVLDSDMTFIAVGTPSRKDGSIDIAYVREAAEGIGKALAKKDAYHTVVVKSTVIPGTTEDIVLPALEKSSGKKAGHDFGVAMNPEFLKEGKAIEDFMNPDRVVIGGMDDESKKMVGRLYNGFDCPVMMTDTKTAEMIKYASNAFLATKISFINEIGNMCKALGIDTYEVAEGMGHDKRIERSFLNSGAGYGGSCFPKDVKAIIAKSKKMGTNPLVMDAVDEVNQRQPGMIIDVLRKKIPSLKGKRIAVLGLAFKPGTDDIREAPSIIVLEALLKGGAEVSAYDPQAADNVKHKFKGVDYHASAKAALDGADACLVLTEWPEFKNLTDEDFKVMRKKVIIEGRRIINPEQVTGFEGICW